MTMRRLGVLVRALPAEATLWAALKRAEEAALVPSVSKLRARQAYWDEQKRLRGVTA